MPPLRWMRRRVSKFAALLASGLAAALAAAAAGQAQDPTPPVFSAVDARGVDVVTGAFTTTRTDVSVGPADTGLALSWYYSSALQNTYGSTVGWRHNFLGTVNSSGSTYTVSIGGASETFTYSGGTFTSDQRRGSTLSVSSGVYTYTLADGTVAQFGALLGAYRGKPLPAANGGYLKTITKPSGEVVTVNYAVLTTTNCTWAYWPDFYCEESGPLGSRIGSVSSTLGYEIVFTYDDDGPYIVIDNAPFDISGWLAPTGAVAVNAAETCGSPCIWTAAGYNDVGSAWNITSALGGTNFYNYSSPSGRLISLQSHMSSGNNVAVAYDGSGRASSVTVYSNYVPTTWTYSYADNTPSSGKRTTTITAPNSSVRTVVSNLSTGLVESETNELGKTTSYLYDSYGRMTRVTAPEGNYTQLTYDARGNVTETRAVAKSGSGLADIVTTATFPSSCTYAVNCNKPTAVYDALGYRTDFTYDNTHGGVLTVTSPAPSGSTPVGSGTRPQTRFSYSSLYAYYSGGAAPTPVWFLTSTSACATSASCGGGADETVTEIGYGSNSVPNNRVPVSVTVRAGNSAVSSTTTTTYNIRRDVATVDGPLSGSADVTRYYYNGARQVTGVVGPDPDGGGSLKHRAVRTTYDIEGKVTVVERGATSSQDAAFDTAFSTSNFTPLERQETGYDQMAGQTVFIRLKDGSGIVTLTQTKYDSLGRPLCTVQRMNASEFASPPSDACDDAAGGAEADRITRTNYNAAGQVTSVQSGYDTALVQTTIEYAYTNNGLVDYFDDASNNRTNYVYDGFDRLVKTEHPQTTVGTETPNSSDYEQLTYDAYGRVTNERRRDGQTFTVISDNLGRITARNAPGSTPNIDFAYDLFGRTTSVSHSVESITYAYDQLSRVTSATSSILGAVSYQYDAAGRRTRLTWPDSFYVTYGYDDAGDLTRIYQNGDTTRAAIDYDDLGRRTQLFHGADVPTTYSYDAISRLSAVTHDPAGTSHDNTSSFGYNPASQVVSRARTNGVYDYSLPGSSGTTSTSYSDNGLDQYTAVGSAAPTYDGLGNLTSDGSKTYGYNAYNQLTSVSGGVSLAYDALGRLRQVSGSSTTRFLYDGTDLIAEYDGSGNLLRRYVHGPGIDEPLLWYEGSGTSDIRTLLADERGSVVAVISGSGTTTNSYDAFGAPASGNVGRFGYTGQIWLPEAGLWHYKARAYHPGLGRFLQTDPIGTAGGLNLYGYAGNDPVNGRDPSGLVMCTGSRIARDSVSDCQGIAGWGCAGACNDPEPALPAVGPDGRCLDPLYCGPNAGGAGSSSCTGNVCTVRAPAPSRGSRGCANSPNPDCVVVTGARISRPPAPCGGIGYNAYGGCFSPISDPPSVSVDELMCSVVTANCHGNNVTRDPFFEGQCDAGDKFCRDVIWEGADSYVRWPDGSWIIFERGFIVDHWINWYEVPDDPLGPSSPRR